MSPLGDLYSRRSTFGSGGSPSFSLISRMLRTSAERPSTVTAMPAKAAACSPPTLGLTQAMRHRGLDGLQPFDRMVAKNIAGRQQRQRDRLFVMRVGLLAGHPDQLLLPHHLSAGEIVHVGDQRDIDFAALHAADQRRRE